MASLEAPPVHTTQSPFHGERPMLEVPGLSVEHLEVDLPAGRFHVARAGRRDRPTLLLVHGFPQHWWCWRGVMNELASSYDLVMPDLLGSGWTEAPAGLKHYRKQSLADDLLGVLDEMEISSATVVGHDWGGYVAQLLALASPERVVRLMAVSIPPVVQDGPPSREVLRSMSYQLLLSAPGSARTLRTKPDRLARSMRADVRNTDNFSAPDAFEFASQFRDPARAKAAQLLYRSFITSDLRTIRKSTKGQKFQMPVRFLRSEHDAYIPAALFHGAESLGDRVEVVTHDRSGHFLPDEDPCFLAGQVLDFAAAKGS